MRAFLAAFEAQIVFGQVVIRRAGSGFELRHQSDRSASPESLATLAGIELRAWALTAERGAFRPLKSAPNLRSGWRAVAADSAGLELLLHYVYPGAVADWFAAQSPHPPVTSYREFTARQTGMYRITTMLSDRIAGAAIRACCHADFCLKRRLWTVETSANRLFSLASAPVEERVRREEDSSGNAVLVEGHNDKRTSSPRPSPPQVYGGEGVKTTKADLHPAPVLEPDLPGQKSLIPCLEPCALMLEFARKVARLEQNAARPSEEPMEDVAESNFDAPNNPRRLRFDLEKQALGIKPAVE